MVKVYLVEDEIIIRQSIKNSIDWEKEGYEFVGDASDGELALPVILKEKPDILITDIRMPGCSGLELIEQVKQSAKQLEIIIISGYAHFEYAQQAIKFGVGDYLLKPISKAELTATLEKLRERICQRQASEQDRQEMKRRAELDVRRMREELLENLFLQKDTELSAQILRETYGMQVQKGCFQAFCLKLDFGLQEPGEGSAAVLMEKAREVLERSLKEKCESFLLGVRDFWCLGILNYEKSRQEAVRRMLKDCLGQIEMQKNLFSSVTFSMSLGGAVTQPEELAVSMKEAAELMQERIVKGTGRVLEHKKEPSALKNSSVMERYLREITQAVELTSVEKADAAVALLEEEVRRTREVRGCEIIELVFSAADIFSAHVQMQERSQRLEAFRRRCGQCRNMEELFSCLADFLREQISELRQKRENDAVRPIRNAKEYIQNHYSEPITLEEVSSAVGLSTAYFSTLFKKTEGGGFAKYLIQVRMEQAKSLLRETNAPVAEICRRVGYNDLKHFTHTFEKTVGVKPATYRKLYG